MRKQRCAAYALHLAASVAFLALAGQRRNKAFLNCGRLDLQPSVKTSSSSSKVAGFSDDAQQFQSPQSSAILGDRSCVIGVAAAAAVLLGFQAAARGQLEGGLGARRSGLRPLQRSRAVLCRATMTAPPEDSAAEEERRYNPWDGKRYTFQELCKETVRTGIWTEADVLEHWNSVCLPLEAVQVKPTGEVALPQHQDSERMWTFKTLEVMWTKKDFGHLHAISGVLYCLFGAIYLLDIALHDIATLSGVEGSLHVSNQAALLAMLVGSLNALSGLQPALLGSWNDLPKLLGFGKNGNLKAAGFLDASVFFFILSYQGLRVLPESAGIALLDPVVGLVGILTIVHSRFVLNGWAERGALERLSLAGVDPVFAPALLNLPVSLHLLLQGQPWMDQMTLHYPGWPQLFWCANFALGWAVSIVLLVLSLYERRVISLELRQLLVVGIPFSAFLVIILRAAVMVPSWLGEDLGVLLTLTPPEA
eukprot:TRINITY_DN14977_c0_g1_i15.p1 TRINITY_DN14977_c0_g1~~TRINITY_DN14977_c0_g1_i15.p1  ORF type:complete len:478 (-),score=94.22 TRINITY_DN14977_c0_g1_i15:731-2164(-)